MRLPLHAGDEITEGVLYRRLPPIKGYVAHDPPDPPRPSSNNFTPDTGEPYLSVELKDDANPDAHMDRMLADPRAIPGSGIFEITVAALRELKLSVKYEPEEGDRHFGVYGWDVFPKKEAIRVRRKASFRAQIIRYPILDLPSATP